MADTLGEMLIEVKVGKDAVKADFAEIEKAAKQMQDNIKKQATQATTTSTLSKEMERRIKEQSRLDAEWMRSMQQTERVAATAQKKLGDGTNFLIDRQERLNQKMAEYRARLDETAQRASTRISAGADTFQEKSNAAVIAQLKEEQRARVQAGDAYAAYTDKKLKFDAQVASSEQRIQKIMSYRNMVEEKLGKSGMYDAAMKENKRFDEQLKGNITTLGEFDKIISRIQRTLYAFAAVTALKYLSTMFTAPVEEAIRFDAEIEKTRLGIASLLTAQGQIADKSGTILEGQNKLNAALTLSDDIIKKLKIDNLSTIATFEQLAHAFQSALSPGLAAGMGLDQIRQFSVAMVQAAGAMGVNLDMMAEELRSLLRGTITPRNTIIATNLGITNDDIKKYKADSQELFNFIMGKLKEFSVAGEESQKTFAGLWSNLKDAFSMSVGEAALPFFENLKKIMKEMLDNMLVVNKVTKELELNPEVVASFKAFFSLLELILRMLIAIGNVMATIGKGVKLTFDFPKELQDVVLKFSKGFEGSEFSKAEELDAMANKAIKATGALKQFGFSANAVKIGQKELNERLKKTAEEFKEIEKGAESLGKKLDDQVIGALEKFNATVMGKDTKFAEIMKRYKQNISDLEAFERDARKKMGPGEVEAYVKPKRDQIEYEKNLSMATKKFEDDRKMALQEIEYLQIRVNVLQDTSNKYLERNKDLTEQIKDAMGEQKTVLDDVADLEDRKARANEINNEIFRVQMGMRGRFAMPQEDREAMLSYIEELKVAYDEINPGENIDALIGSLNQKASSIGEYIRKSTEDADSLLKQSVDVFTQKLYGMIEQWGKKLEVENRDLLDMKTVQGGITEFLKEQTGLENTLYTTEQKREALIRYMSQNNLTGDEYQAAIKSLSQFDQTIFETQNQLRIVSGYLDELEKQRTIILSANTEDPLNKVKDLNTAVEDAKKFIEEPVQINLNINPALDLIRELKSRIDAAMSSLNSLSQSSGSSGGSFGPLGNSNFSLGDMESDYTINFLGAASPVKAFTDTYNDVMNRLNSLPSGSTFQIDFLMKKMGMSGSESLDYMGMNSKMQGLQQAYDSALEQSEYWKHAYNGLSFGNESMSSYYQSAAEQIAMQMNQLNTQMYATLADSYNNRSSTTSGASGGSSSGSGSYGGGTSIQIGSIIINTDALSRDSAILLADRLDEELARKIKASDSKTANALKKKGLS